MKQSETEHTSASDSPDSDESTSGSKESTVAAWMFPELDPLHMPDEAVEAGIFEHSVAHIFGLEDDAGRDMDGPARLREPRAVTDENPELTSDGFAQFLERRRLALSKPLAELAFDLAWDCDIRTRRNLENAFAANRVAGLKRYVGAKWRNLSNDESNYVVVTSLTITSDEARGDTLRSELGEVVARITEGGALAQQFAAFVDSEVVGASNLSSAAERQSGSTSDSL